MTLASFVEPARLPEENSVNPRNSFSTMSDRRPDPDALLASLHREEARARRGRLKVFFGMCPGVGKTYAMLRAAQQELRDRVDVVVGVVETHGRRETEALLDGLPVVPRKQIEHRGIELTEFDLDAVLARQPQLVLVDELAHTNAPGSRHPKRYQDVIELLDAGIDVFTTLNVQHIESRADTVRQITGRNGARDRAGFGASSWPTRSSWSTSRPRRCASGWRRARSISVNAPRPPPRIFSRIPTSPRCASWRCASSPSAWTNALREFARHGSLRRSGVPANGCSSPSVRVRFPLNSSAGRAGWQQLRGRVDGGQRRIIAAARSRVRVAGSNRISPWPANSAPKSSSRMTRTSPRRWCASRSSITPRKSSSANRGRRGCSTGSRREPRRSPAATQRFDRYLRRAGGAGRGKDSARLEWQPPEPSPLHEYVEVVTVLAAMTLVGWFASHRLHGGWILPSGGDRAQPARRTMAGHCRRRRQRLAVEFPLHPTGVHVRHREVRGRHDVRTYFVVALIAGQLTARIRAQERHERLREERATALFHLTQALSAARSLDEAVFAALRQADGAVHCQAR